MQVPLRWFAFAHRFRACVAVVPAIAAACLRLPAMRPQRGRWLGGERGCPFSLRARGFKVDGASFETCALRAAIYIFASFFGARFCLSAGDLGFALRGRG